MPVGIVDLLEMVEIDECQSERLLIGNVQPSLEDIEECAAVGQAGERIGPCFARHLQLLELACGNVTDRDHEAAYFPTRGFHCTQLCLKPAGLPAPPHRPLEYFGPARMAAGFIERAVDLLTIELAEKCRKVQLFHAAATAQPGRSR